MLSAILIVFSGLAGFAIGYLSAILCHGDTKVGTPSASHNKPRNAISKRGCITCGYHPKEESWSIVCDCPCTCYSGEMWKPLETASVG